MAAKTPIIIVSSTSISAKYVLALCRGGRAGPVTPVTGASPSAGGSVSFHEASTTTGIRTTVIRMRTSAMPSTPTA